MKIIKTSSGKKILRISQEDLNSVSKTQSPQGNIKIAKAKGNRRKCYRCSKPVVKRDVGDGTPVGTLVDVEGPMGQPGKGYYCPKCMERTKAKRLDQSQGGEIANSIVDYNSGLE